MKFSHVVVADSSETILYGAASLRTGAVNTSSNEKISVGCLVKIEMNVAAHAIRITVRTTSPAASTAILNAAKLLLA